MNEEVTIDLKEYLRVLGKWKWLIALVTMLAVVTSGILSWFVLPPVYQAKAVIQVIRGEQRPAATREAQTLEDVVGTLSRLPQMTINTYVSQLKNQVVFQRVISRLELDEELYTPAGVAGMVAARAVRDTNLIEVEVNNTEPQLAAGLANAISDEFMTFINENNQQQLSKSMELLTGQMESTDQELAAAVEALRNFDAQPRGVEYLAKQMERRLADLSDYRSQQVSTEVTLQQELAGKSRLAERLAVTPAVITVTTRETVPQEGDGSGQEDAATQVVEQPNPAYDQFTRELAAREIRIAELQARAAAMVTLVADLEKEIADLQAESAGKRAERARLQASEDRLEDTYSILADNITRTQVIRSINIGDASLMVVSRAVIPTDPIRPRKMLNLAVAFVLGLMGSVLLVFLLEVLDNTIKTAEDVGRHLGIPVLGSIPLHGPGEKTKKPRFPGITVPAAGLLTGKFPLPGNRRVGR